MKYDPGRVRLAKKMARQFRGKDEAVMAHLTKVYANGGPGKLDQSAAEGKKKKKKKDKKKNQETAVVDESSVVESTSEEVVVEEPTAEAVEETVEAGEETKRNAGNNGDSVIDDLDD